MDLLHRLFDTLLHLTPDKVTALAEHVGSGLYVILFLIIFCETGLVILPFLPGDSLLFALGAVSMEGTMLNLPFLMVLLCTAAILGDAVNYWIGYRLGPKVFASESSRLLNKKHLLEAQRFYEKHGGKTIILARFIPIIRTFAPFVAGIGRMNYFKFALYNITGGVVWVVSFLMLGHWFGRSEIVKRNFHMVIVAIIVISVIPVAIEILRARRAKRRELIAAAAAATAAEQSVPPRA